MFEEIKKKQVKQRYPSSVGLMQGPKTERNQFKEHFRDMKPTQSTVKEC